jgi:hypothetical protein
VELLKGDYIMPHDSKAANAAPKSAPKKPAKPKKEDK